MEENYKFLKYVLVLILLFIYQACSAVPINLTKAKEEVIKYHESGRYDEEAAAIIDDAIDKFENLKAGEGAAVVFDIDETALSNFEYSKKYDFGYVPHLWNEWINESRAPAVTEVKKLYDFLVSKGFKILFITGRKDFLYNATYKNLYNAGYNKFDTLIVRASGEYELSALEYKSNKREELTKAGYNIVGNVGDQYSDLEGPYSGIRVKIPNYQYIVE